jgi:hypothetical protein
MPEPTEADEIVLRANRLWEQAGSPSGKYLQYYYQAERELRYADELGQMPAPDKP